jgi:hypothetical protein
MRLFHRSSLSPRRAAITALDDVLGEIEGYIHVWNPPGSVDEYGTWFDRESPPELALDFLPLPVSYEHAMDKIVAKEIVGKIERLWFDDVGLRFSAQLNRASPFFQRIVNEIRAGKLATSSATAEHLSEFDADGRFVKWWLSELALTADPAENTMPIVTLVRSMPRGAGNPHGADDGARTVTSTGQRNMEINQIIADAMAAGASPQEIIAALTAQGISVEDLMALLQQAAQPAPEAEATLSAPVAPSAQPNVAQTAASALAQLIQSGTGGQRRAPNTASDPMAGQIAALQQQVALMQASQRQQQAAPPVSPQNAATPRGRSDVFVVDPYAHLTPAQMATAYALMMSSPQRERSDERSGASEPFMRAMTYKSAVAAEAGDPVNGNYAVRSLFPGMSGRGGRPLRANEAMQSNLSGFGDEWVYALQGTSIWEALRAETRLFDLMQQKGMEVRELPMGFEGETVPLEGADMTWYVAGQAADEDASSGMLTPTFSPSKVPTPTSKTISIAKLSARTPWTAELNEDSFVNMAAEIERKVRVSGAEQIESILLNGDTDPTANTNINLIDGTPAAAPARPAYTLLNGLLKLALVTNTGNSRACGAIFDELDFLETLKMLPVKSRTDRAKLLYILDPDTALVAANIPAVKTRDSFSPATLEQGNLTSIYRIDVYESAYLALANTVGKISGTAGNNMHGRLTIVRPDQWAFRWKRKMKTDLAYTPRSDSYEVVVHMRLGWVSRDNEASAVTYGIPQALV